MRWFKSSTLRGAVLILLSLAYPFAIYFLGGHLSAVYILGGGMAVWLLNLGLQYQRLASYQMLLPPSVLLLLGLMLWWDEERATLMYPVVTNLSFASMLSISLLYPPSLIERLARLTEPELDARGIAYTKNVTIVWLLFSLSNAFIAMVTVWIGDRELWLLYNACISYLLTGLLLAGEYLFRLYYKRKGNKPNE
jgi:uncharacterized membrane protein